MERNIAGREERERERTQNLRDRDRLLSQYKFVRKFDL